jgi:trk system potassium uptake protein TrkH
MGLGGFPTHDASFGYFNSVPIELVAEVFMVICAMNFSRHFLAWQQKSVKVYARDAEAEAMLWLLGVSILVVTLYIWLNDVYPSFWTSLRHVTFNLVAYATTSGFVTQDYSTWPVFAPMVIVMLSCYTCNTGSTGGGIKMFRTLVLLKQAIRELMLQVHPQAVTPVKIRGQVVSNKIVFAVLAFVVLYFVTVVTLTFLLLASGSISSARSPPSSPASTIPGPGWVSSGPRPITSC